MKNDEPNADGQAPISSDANDGHTQEAETAAFLALVAALRPLPEGSRARVVNAVLTFVGVRSGQPEQNAPVVRADMPTSSPAHDEAGELPRRASVWISQANLSLSDLDSVFHRTPGGVEVIAHSVPGKSNKERVRSCYLLSGVQGLLKAGEARFADEDARRICRELGCYDKANHATYVKALGNLVTGTKSTSYELTQPGLRAAAEVMKEMQTLAGSYSR